MTHSTSSACAERPASAGSPTNPTLLLVNGLGSQSTNYADAWCDMLAVHDLHVVRYDNRDVGLSTKFDSAPQGPYGEAYLVGDMADDGFAVLDALGVERAHVMGLSMGGMIVQTMAIEQPERLITMTSAMSSTGEPEYMKSTPRAAELLTAPPAIDRDGYIQGWVDGQREWGSPEFADEDRWRADAARAFDRSFHPGGSARQYLAIRASGDRAERLRSVTVPTLVIHGDNDTLIDAIGGRRTAELIPGARFELIAGMGHDYPPQLWRTWVDLVVGHVQSHT
ncbi:MAG: alpha/beta fold hydrolase [Actinomycetota bacterium]